MRYCMLLFFLLLFSKTSAQPSIHFLSDTTIDIGQVPEDSVYHLYWTFKNISKSPVIITAVKNSGGNFYAWCKEKDPIMPGKTATIQGDLDGRGHPGTFSKSSFVETNTGERVRINVTGIFVKKGFPR